MEEFFCFFFLLFLAELTSEKNKGRNEKNSLAVHPILCLVIKIFDYDAKVAYIVWPTRLPQAVKRASDYTSALKWNTFFLYLRGGGGVNAPLFFACTADSQPGLRVDDVVKFDI